MILSAFRARSRLDTYHTQAKTHIQKEGLPRFYIRTLAELEDCLDVALKDREAQKKMSKANGRALNRMKLQRLILMKIKNPKNLLYLILKRMDPAQP